MAYRGSVHAPQSEIVQAQSAVDVEQTTAGTWNGSGSWTSTDGAAAITVAVSSDQVVTLTIEESDDSGSTVDLSRSVTIPASTEVRRLVIPARKYVRVKVANASGSTATLRVATRTHGTPVDPRWLLADPTWRQHRLITEANVSTEAGENWVSDQAINARATSDDSTGVYRRGSTGTAGFEVVAFWVDSASDYAVVHTTNTVTLRPELRFTVGAVTRVAHAAAAQTAAAGTVMSFADSAPGDLWLKVDAATAPGGAETHLQVYVQEVNS